MELRLVSSNDDFDVEYTTVLTPRQRELLGAELAMMADEAYDDVERFGDRTITDSDDPQVLDLLPELTWTENGQWRRQFARAFDDLATDLTDEQLEGLPTPRCTAEEMALHLAIDRAQATQSDESGEHLVAHLPQQPADRNWDDLRQDLFQDEDVLLMFEMSELPSPDSEYHLLRPENWFLPFESDGERRTDRGFRR